MDAVLSPMHVQSSSHYWFNVGGLARHAVCAWPASQALGAGLCREGQLGALQGNICLDLRSPVAGVGEGMPTSTGNCCLLPTSSHANCMCSFTVIH